MSDKKKTYFQAILPEAEVGFCHLDAPDTQGKFADGKYKFYALFDKGTDFTELKQLMLDAANEEWGVASLQGIELPIRDGNTMKTDKGEPKEWAQNKLVAQPKSKFAPRQYDEKGTLLSEGGIRGGDVVRANVTIYPCAPKGCRTIALQLNELQRVAAGERRQGSASAFAGRPVENQRYVPAAADASSADYEPPF